MRAFTCPHCGALLFFENSQCLACGSTVGYDRRSGEFVLVPPGLRCANAEIAACNWTAPGPDPLCDCCQLTRTRPNDADTAGMAAFVLAQGASRRLLYQLDDLGLPVRNRDVDPDHGLAFDLLSSLSEPVTTGHDNGIITIDLAEGDAGHREALRVHLAEPYRTMLGHFRHEVGHYYWTVLVEGRPALEVFRALFGDERADYAAALQAHYTSDPEPNWEETHVSTYATAHPWEDWAETWAHYLHIRDSLQTAAAYGIIVAGPEVDTPPDPTAPLSSVPLEDHDDFDDLIDSWLPLTYALNQVNRSMGKRDLYPFVLSPTVLEKLRLVHSLIAAETAGRPAS
ncbi:MAG TPA: putative zinc-binding metallopeptidase [Sporichthyaceae bacterium]|nr:putative zinc-binding metallopeptidase [Sporichthyaceae bacterium]